MNTDWPNEDFRKLPCAAIDARLYTERKPPTDLNDESVAVDYMMRVCSAYDFQIPPSKEVTETLRHMRFIFDRYPLSSSIGYHALRRKFGWPELPFVGPIPNPAGDQDFWEGREPDPILI